MPSSKREPDENVYLFVPNVIGYLRLITCVWSCAAMRSHPILAVFLYSLSCILDAADGWAARAYDQHSRFGAVLDMVLDRMTTLCLLIRLAVQLPPSLILAVQFLAGLDLVSHYAHMYASLVTGSESHKKIDPHAPWLLRLYYESKLVLFLVCLFDQLFYICVFWLTWRDPMSGELLFLVSKSTGSSSFLNETSAFLLETIFVPIAGSSFVKVALVSVQEMSPIRLGIWIFALFSGIVCLCKQLLNVIQLVGAAQELVAFDIKSRAKGKRRAKNH
ncbi:CDP-alcohol phosphatidyltransferase-domain-containing protein [Chytriomyces sp. MP71]|nr:CDP-alcohol phosphatidyltransferase-domain-containing protein [Chytriomyces sp. MP71]